MRTRTASYSEGGNLYKARSRLYRIEILQENMRLKALSEIYKMHEVRELVLVGSQQRLCFDDMNPRCPAGLLSTACEQPYQ